MDTSREDNSKIIQQIAEINNTLITKVQHLEELRKLRNSRNNENNDKIKQLTSEKSSGLRNERILKNLSDRNKAIIDKCRINDDNLKLKYQTISESIKRMSKLLGIKLSTEEQQTGRIEVKLMFKDEKSYVKLLYDIETYDWDCKCLLNLILNELISNFRFFSA